MSSQGLTQISSLGTEQRDPKHKSQVSQSKDTMNLWGGAAGPAGAPS